MFTFVSAAGNSIPVTPVTPYSALFTPLSTTSTSIASIKTALNFHSCTIDANWQSKNCQYMYWCYAILPSTSASISDAVQKQCNDITDITSDTDVNVNLTISNFVPPVGKTYYVSTFITLVNETCSGSCATASAWTPTAIIPTVYTKATSIISTCPNSCALNNAAGCQMLYLNQAIPAWQCKSAQAVCNNNLYTGLCTNTYNTYALDLGSGYQISNTNSLCVDRTNDGICDNVASGTCSDICSTYTVNNATGVESCTTSGANGICDDTDMLAPFSCVQGSIHSKVCSNIDTALCAPIYVPVCVATTAGTINGGTTYPNGCFVTANKGFGACASQSNPLTNCYVNGACVPPITQCYTSGDCPAITQCNGGSIVPVCTGYRCSYSGACGTLTCNQNSDCAGINLPCVGVAASCDTGSHTCQITGQCIAKPVASTTIWTLIGNAWTSFWTFVKGLFGA